MTATTAIRLFERQKRVLAFLHAFGDTVGNLDFQKLLFLYCEELAQDAPYDFVPYKYGAFSFSSYADRRRLVEHGLLKDSEREWSLTDAGIQVVKEGRLDTTVVDSFVRNHRELRGDALVAESYRRHPYYAIRSEIAGRVLAGDREALSRISAAQPSFEGGSLATIGYEGRTLEGYLNELIQHGTTLLCDVRRNAISRKYGFSKSTLARGCDGVGIRYEHMPELGIASDDRRALNTPDDYRLLFEDYVENTLPNQQGALRRLQSWITSGERVALTCYERAAHSCHRHCVANALEALSPEALKVRDL
jgi:hypothetical protein